MSVIKGRTMYTYYEIFSTCVEDKNFFSGKQKFSYVVFNGVFFWFNGIKHLVTLQCCLLRMNRYNNGWYGVGFYQFITTTLTHFIILMKKIACFIDYTFTNVANSFQSHKNEKMISTSASVQLGYRVMYAKYISIQNIAKTVYKNMKLCVPNQKLVKQQPQN